MKKANFIFSFFLFIIIYLNGWLSPWESFAIVISIYFLFDFLIDLGNKIHIMQLATIMAALTCLFMPVIFYHVYPKENPLARLWVKYMPISSDEYFSFAAPAVTALFLGIRLPLGKLSINKNPRLYIINAKKKLAANPRVGLTLIAVGLISGFLDFLSPESLKQVFYLLDHLSYVGVFYLIYSPNKYKKIMVPVVISLTVAQSLATGMFGELVMMLACTIVILLLGNETPFYKKFLMALMGMFFILLIQSVKPVYREKIWVEGGGSDPAYYSSLLVERIINPSLMLDPDKLFFVSVRMNQGWLVAVTMERVPKRFDFAYGETIWKSIAAAILPRFLWPDKPITGGKYNLKRFWGFDLKGFSMNIGPLGEAYANFNVIGGIIFMFFYGLFFNLMLSLIVKLAEKRPTIILWVPFLFFYAIVVETDLLTTMGSLVKGLIFTWIIFRSFKAFLRIDL